MHLPDIDDLRAAETRIAAHTHRTPVLTSRTLDARFGAELYFKCENFQRAGAFKFRGACNAVLAATDDGGGGDDPTFEPAELGGEVGDALARLFLRFREVGVSVELHMFAQGAHGFGLRPLRSGPVHHWPERFLEWLEATCLPSHLRSRPRSADSFVTHGRL